MNIAAFGIVVKGNDVLLVNRRFPPQLWAPPGGFMDPGEAPQETVKRETWEETRIVCNVLSKLHEFDFNNSHLLVYACEYLSGELECSYESLEVQWFNINDLPNPISPQADIFLNAVEYVNTHRKRSTD